MNTLRVGLAEFPPLVSGDYGHFRGFEVDLWETVAGELGFQFEYRKYPFQKLIPMLAEGKLDVAMAGITINEDRERIIDFSHPTMDSGLVIAVDRDRNRLRLSETVRAVVGSGYRTVSLTLLAVLSFIFALGNLLWLAERGVGTFSEGYFPGVFEASWLVFSSVTTVTFGDFYPNTWLGRAVVFVSVVGGVGILATLVARFTAFLATRKVWREIAGISDLSGRKVAAVSGSTSEQALTRLGTDVTGTETVGEALMLLERREVEAVVADAPVLAHHLKDSRGGRVETVGDVFDGQKYGIALQQGSPLRENVNRTLLRLIESGRYGALYRQWFGQDPSMEI
ncbi:transporter substrate-binding domain-containing protein [Candidatus Uhrbacteria bacterium]|nr:transporter substrate-binding domain-containing protein [Candidatus Uhrbacteria bacterium]